MRRMGRGTEGRGVPARVDASAAEDAQGAAESFESFFEEEHGNLFGALVLVTGDRHEAEELMQESFVRVWERWDRVSLMDSPSGYLYRTAMNGFRMRRRRARVAARRLFRRGSSADPLDAVELRDSVDRALAALTPRQRAAVVLTALLDYTSEEAGELLGVKAATVRSLATQARAAIREAEGAGDE